MEWLIDQNRLWSMSRSRTWSKYGLQAHGFYDQGLES